MNSVNSLITTFKPKKKTSIAYVIDARGEIITLSNGCVSVKSLIIEFETKIEKTIVSICANFLVHFDFANSHSNLVKDYSPIACLQVEGEAKTKKLYNVDHPFFIPFKHVNEFEFFLLKEDKTKISGVKFELHMFYKIC